MILTGQVKKWILVGATLSAFGFSLVYGYFYAMKYYSRVGKSSIEDDSTNQGVIVEQQDEYKQAEINVNDQIRKQANGFPLIENPFNGGYQLNGALSNIVEDTVEVSDGFLIHLQGIFTYKDSSGTNQTIKLPLIVENKKLQMTQLYTGVADKPFDAEMTDWVINEKLLGDMQGPHQVQLLLATATQLKEEFYGTRVVTDLIGLMHAQGFSQFHMDGQLSTLGNQEWIIPMEISFLPR